MIGQKIGVGVVDLYKRKCVNVFSAGMDIE